MPAVIIRQRKTFRRKDGQFIYFEDNAGEHQTRTVMVVVIVASLMKRRLRTKMLAQLRAMPVKSCLINLFAGVIVNNKGEMKGSAITGERFRQSNKFTETQNLS